MSRGMFFYNVCEEQSQSHENDHVTESCYLCARPFYEDSDIYMYRGNKPFCSDDCRQEQIDFDEAKERKKVKKVVAMGRLESEQAINSSDLRQVNIEVAGDEILCV